MSGLDPVDLQAPPLKWLTVRDAARHVHVGPKVIYRAIQSKTHPLRCVRVGGRRELRFLATWVDNWLLSLGEWK